MTAVVAAQGWGQFAAAVIGSIVVTAFKSSISSQPSNEPMAVDICWRIIIGLGAIPGTLALYFRLTIPETPRFTMDIQRNIHQAAHDIDTFFTTGTFLVDPVLAIQKAHVPKASLRDFLG